MWKKLQAILLLLGAIVLVAFVGLGVVLTHSAGRPNVSLAFLGYTNGTDGRVFARFCLTNLSDSDLSFYHGMPFQAMDPTATNGVTQLDDPVLNEAYGFRSLKAGTGRMLYRDVAQPMRAPWKLPVPINAESGVIWAVKCKVAELCEDLHLSVVPVRYELYEFYTPWINELPPNTPTNASREGATL